MDSSLQNLANFFILSLVFGTYIFQFLVNPNDTGRGFIRLVTGILLGGLGISLALTISSFGITSTSTYLLIGAVGASVFFYLYHPDGRDFLSKIIYSLVTILLLIFYFISLDPISCSYLLAGALLLGITNFLMVLGHYYLVVPKLTEKPLLNGHYLFWPIILIKTMISFYFIINHLDYFSLETQAGDGGMFNILLVSMRVLWGYVALGVLSYFSYRLCLMRSTQSATGVLYIMVFFVLVGELISFYYFFKFGWFV